MAEFTPPAEQIVAGHFIVSDDVERSRRFYTGVLYQTRCYIRDPDGYLIEGGQTTNPRGDWSPWLPSAPVSRWR